MNTPQPRTIRPGLLVSLSTSNRGNITYRTQPIENYIDELGQERTRWETTRVTTDPAEHDEAIKVRSKARGLITRVCAASAFGLLCPEANAPQLFDAVAEARALTDDFNSRASVTRLQVNVIVGRIAADDVEAVRAITGEVRALMEDMSEGLKSLDVAAVRAAANKARDVGSMLSPDAQERLSEAIDVARREARRIVKAGEVIGTEIDQTALARIDAARTAFLDVEGEQSTVAMPEMDGRGIDFDTIGPPEENGRENDEVDVIDEDVPLTDDEYYGDSITTPAEDISDYSVTPLYASTGDLARAIEWEF